MTDSYNPRARIPSRSVAKTQAAPLPWHDSGSGTPSTTPAPQPVPPLVIVRHGTPKLAEAIAAVQREVGVVNKGGENKFHNYKYARIEDILEVVTPLMGQHGISILQSELDVMPVESRIVVKNEFHVMHVSGEIQGPFYKYGMSNARDSRGNYDDKCINKAHTQARRYFMVGLFNIPTAELDDNERDQQQQRRDEKPKQQAVPPRNKPKEDTHIPPRKISLGAGSGADKWAEVFIKMIGQAVSKQEVMQWDKLNNDALQSLAEGFEEVYERVCAAIEARSKALTNNSEAIAAAENIAAYMPDPQKDAIAACNWVAQQLADLKTPDAVEAFWQQVVEPRQSAFTPPDYEVLLIELHRAEGRLGVVHKEGVADDEEEEKSTEVRGTPG